MPQAAMNIAIAVLILVWIGWRQLQLRPVKDRSIVPYIIVGLGIVQLVQFSQGAAVPAEDWLVVAGSLIVGAVFAAARAWTVRLNDVDGVAMRRGTWLTVTLWIVAVAVHLLSEPLFGTAHLGQVSLTLYLGAMILVQRELVLLRTARDGLTPRARQRRRTV